MIDIEVAERAWTAALPRAAALARQAAVATAPKGAAQIAILLAGDDAVRSLNARFRGQDKATNVLAFPAVGGASGHLGDIALAFGVCSAEATGQNKPLADHLRHLVTHGVLHLMGYDHQDPAQAREMEAAERAILARMNIPDPYAETP